MFDEQNEPEHELTSELAAVERQLRGLTPTTPQIDRDRLMFAAGRAAGECSRELVIGNVELSPGPSLQERGKEAATLRVAGIWFWRTTAAMMTAATVLLATMLVWRNHSPATVEQETKPQVVNVVLPASDNHDARMDEFTNRQIRSAPPTTSGYLGARYVALTRGIGAMLELQPVSYDMDSSPGDSRVTPTTARGLLHELQPVPAQSNPRS
jgi:hypothetical protein